MHVHWRSKDKYIQVSILFLLPTHYSYPSSIHTVPFVMQVSIGLRHTGRQHLVKLSVSSKKSLKILVRLAFIATAVIAYSSCSLVSQNKSIYDACLADDPLRVPLRDRGVNVIAGVIKKYLRELADPLIPTSFYDRFITAASKFMSVCSLSACSNSIPNTDYMCETSVCDTHLTGTCELHVTPLILIISLFRTWRPSNRVAALFLELRDQDSQRRCIISLYNELPEHHHNTLQYMVRHFCSIVDVQSESYRLAPVFAHILLRPDWHEIT